MVFIILREFILLQFGKHLFSVLYNNTQKFDVHILSPYNDQKLLKILFNSIYVSLALFRNKSIKFALKCFYMSPGIWVGFGLLYTISFHVHTL